MRFCIKKHYFFDPVQGGPDVSSVPAGRRRKMSQLTKMTLFVASKVEVGMPVVFSSRFGEWGQTLKQIENKISEGWVSPTGFGLSVHNAAVGILSLLNENHAPYTAISAGKNSLPAGLTEALAMLADYENVLLIHADEEVPERYRETFTDDYRPFALAAVLAKAGGRVFDNPDAAVKFISSCQE